MTSKVPDYCLAWDAEGVTFRLNRPKKSNAINTAILEGLHHCLEEIERRSAAWLVVIGEGDRVFCAGTDLDEAARLSPDEIDAKNLAARTLLHRLAESPAISVAAINGGAHGGGLEVAMACTFRIAAPHAQLSLPEIKLGVLPSYGGTQFLPALVGRARALDLMLTGRSVDAAEALAIGLVTCIAEPGRPLLEQAQALARGIAGQSRMAVAAIRRCVAASGPAVGPEGLAVEDREVRSVMRSEAAQEGIRAFLEKRPPVLGRS